MNATRRFAHSIRPFLHHAPTHVGLAAAAVVVAALFVASPLAAQTDYQWQITSSGGLWSVGGNWSPTGPANGANNSADFSTLLLTGNNTVHLDAPETIGALVFADRGYTYNWTLDNNGSAANSLTLSGAASITVNNDTATIGAVLGGNSGLTVSAAGLVTVNGGEVYYPTEPSNIATSAALTLNPAAVESYTGTTTLNSGSLLLDFSNLATPTNLINSGSPLVLADGALAVKNQSGANTTLQSFDGTTFSGGASAISVNVNGNTNSGSALALGAITRAIAGAVNFTLPTTGSITTTTANGFGSGGAAILGGYAVVTTQNNVTWAVSASDGVNPGAIGGLPQSAYTANVFGSNVNTSVTASSSFSSSTSTNSLYFNTPGGVLGGSGTLTVNSGGVLVSPNVGASFANVTGTITTGNPQNDLIVNQDDPNGLFGLSGSAVTDNGSPVSITKTGPGTLYMVVPATSGTIYLNQGVMAYWENFMGSGSTVTFTGNSTWQLFTNPGTPGTAYVGNLVKTIDAGVTATFDNIDVASNATALSESNGYYTGPGSLAIISSFGKTNGAFLILGGIITADGNSYGGSTTLMGTEITARYGDPTGNINRFNPNAPFYMGGVLQLQPATAASGHPATVQTLGSNWSLIPDTASTLATLATVALVPGTTFNLSSPTGGMTRGSGAATTFAPYSTDTITTFHVGGAVNSNPGMIGGWATYGSNAANAITLTISDWAALNASNNVVSYTALGGVYNTNTWSGQTDITTSGSYSGTTNSVRFNTTTACTITLSGPSTIASGGILNTTNVNGQANVITGGSITSGNGSDLIVNQFDTNASGSFTIASQITNNGATPIGLTVTGNTQGTTGSGSVVAISNPANNYTGATVINAACTLQATAANVIPSGSAVILSERATLNLEGNSQSIGSLAAVSYGTTVIAGGSGVTLTVGNDNTNTTFNGAITGSLGLVKVGAGTLTLNDISSFTLLSGQPFGNQMYLAPSLYGSGNTYSGGTTINGGTISIELDGALGASSGGVTIDGTSIAPATLQATATIASNRTINLGPTSGAGLGSFDVVAPYTLTLAGVVENTTGGSGGLVKTDGGTLVLSNGGNTYSGGTTITGGILNIASDTVLGATTANPNITFNGSVSSGGGTLQFASNYSGTTLGSGRNIAVAAGDVGAIDTNSNNITWGGVLTIGAGGALTKTDSSGAGAFTIQAAPTLNNNSALNVIVGTLRFNVTSGSATVGSGVTATVASGATLELAGSVPALGVATGSLSGVANVVNNSQAATTGGLHVTGTSQQVGTVTGSGNTVVESGASLTAYQIRQNSLTINGTGVVTLFPSGSGSVGNPQGPNNTNNSSNVTSLTIAGTTNAWTGTLDIGNNGLVIQYGSGADPFATIENMVESGYNGGAWGGKGITSSLAAASISTSHPLNIGLEDFTPNANGFGPSITFTGQTITTNAVLVRLTYMDDLVLAGDMSQNDATNDALLFAANYGIGTTWSVGDITHDGSINSNDALLFAANYFVSNSSSLDGTTGNAVAVGGAAAVPEPATILLALMGSFALGWCSRFGRAPRRRL